MQVKDVIDFDVERHYEKKIRTINSKKIKERLSGPNPPVGEPRIYLYLASTADHQGKHDIGEVSDVDDVSLFSL